MTRKYKTSYKGPRPVKRFTVTFDAPAIAANIQEACTICHGKIEESPMMRGVCYNCYRDLIAAEQHKALQIVLDVASAQTPAIIDGVSSPEWFAQIEEVNPDNI